MTADSETEIEDLNLRNSNATSGTFDLDNLTDMLMLNEPEVLRCLKTRFYQNRIYTYTGIPFESTEQ